MDSRSYSHHRDHYHHPSNPSSTHRGGGGGPTNHGPTSIQQSKRNYKLLIDPFIVKGGSKLYRFEGVVDGDPSYPTAVLRDPRKQNIWIRPETLDLSVPRFKIDSNYVGPPPPLEVTIFNINDNIDEQFLYNEIVNKHQCGALEDLHIYTQEYSRKHLGFAHLIFEEPESARMCVKKMNDSTLMGKVLQVFLDPFGNACKTREEEIRKEEEAKEARKKPPPAPPSKPPEEEEPEKVETPKPRHRQRSDSEKDFNDVRYEERKGPLYPSDSSTTSSSTYYRDQPPHRPMGPYPPGVVGASQPPYPPPYEQFHHPHHPPQNVHPQQQQQQQQHTPHQQFSNYPYQDYRPGYPPTIPPGHHWGNSTPQAPPMTAGVQPHPPPPPQHHAQLHGGSLQPTPNSWPPNQQPNSLPQEHPWEARYKEYQRNSHSGGGEPHEESCADENAASKTREEAEVNHEAAAAVSAAVSAAGERAALPTEAQPHQESEPPKNDSEDDDDLKPSLDLETRIALLLQNKDNTIAAPFLNLADASGDEDEGKDDGGAVDITRELQDTKIRSDSERMEKSSKCLSGSGVSSGSALSSGSENGVSDKMSDDCGEPEVEEGPLSTPPSPFLSKEQYLFWHEKSLELKKEAQEREKEENKERLKKLKKKKLKRKFKEKLKITSLETLEPKGESKDETQVNGVDDDRMSLSSLSSTEDPILHQDVPIPPSFNAPPPVYHQSYVGQDGVSSYIPPGYHQPPPVQQEVPYSWQLQPQHGYPQGIPNNSTNYPNFPPNYIAYPPPGVPGYPLAGPTQMGAAPPGHIPMYPAWPGYPLVSGPNSDGHQSGHYHDPTVNSVLDTVIDELKRILKKDFNRRMIEATAFKTFESWWDEQETKFKAQKEAREHLSEAAPPAIVSRSDKISTISNLFESKEGGFGLDGIGGIGSFGLGFRAAMPKMPSFKKIRKIKPPSPPCLDEDSRGIPSDEDSKQSSSLHQAPEQSSLDSDPEESSVQVSKKATAPLSKVHISESETSSSSEDEVEEENESSGSSSESSTSSSSASESEREEEDMDEEEHGPMATTPAEAEELKELQRLEEEFNSEIHDIVEGVMKTPERESRPPTPLPIVSVNEEETWLDVISPESSPVKSLSPTKPPLLVSSSIKEKELTVRRRTPTSKIKGKLKTKTLHSKHSDVSSETDTADEKSDSDPLEHAVEVPPVKPLRDYIQHNGQLKSSSSSDGNSHHGSEKGEKRHSPVLMEHSYCLPWEAKEKQSLRGVPPSAAPAAVLSRESPKKSAVSGLDHDYTTPRSPPRQPPPFKSIKKSPKPPRHMLENLPGVKSFERIKYNNKKPSGETFVPRNQIEEYNALYSFLMKGIDQEDIELLKRSYEKMLADDRQSYWLNDTHWVDHPPTDIPSPPRKKRKPDDLPLHKTGCARTEGKYKVDSKQKQKHKFTFHEEIAQMPDEPQQQSLAVLESSKAKPTQMSVSREVRSFQRRLLAAFGNETDSDLLKFNQLKFRRKLLKFGKSRIHDWGLFAMEAIASDEMVIEYVGQSIRPIIADVREVHYKTMGIGSSYLFRIDMENIIDATKCGNLARFINHSCNPNCYARIISVENRKKIVIYSKQPIPCGEEITYDYKFPIEEEKIFCLCGGSSCKGTLN